MHAIQRTFNKSHVVLPVIHCLGKKQASQNAQVAKDCGADGVFLISHGDLTAHELAEIAGSMIRQLDLWVGLNLLGSAAVNTFGFVQQWAPDVKGIWVDNACINEHEEGQHAADRIKQARELSQWLGLYFGGVAFKYQRSVKDFRRAASIATNYMDVVTTSGPGTGKAAEVAKVLSMRDGMQEHALGIASGVTPDNVYGYLPYVNAFLVATGISKDFYNLDPLLTQKLVKVVEGFCNPAGA